MRKPPRRRTQVKAQKPKMHLRRTHASVKLTASGELGKTQSTLEGRIFLNEIRPKGLDIFTTEALPVGKQVAISVEAPKQFFVKAKVKWCQENYDDVRIISEKNFKFRCGLVFVFSSPEEEASVKKYCEEIYAEYVTDEAA